MVGYHSPEATSIISQLAPAHHIAWGTQAIAAIHLSSHHHPYLECPIVDAVCILCQSSML